MCTYNVINQYFIHPCFISCRNIILEDLKLRNRMDIIANILNSIRANRDAGASKSHIVETADVSYMKLKEYTPLLYQYGLWKLDEKTNLHYITDRGLEYLELYQLMSELEGVIPRKAIIVMH
jgi:predicted transcriptional regulator